jgi:uncharacterized membrane protein YdjX (TVP38/TMEM64 family)
VPNRRRIPLAVAVVAWLGLVALAWWWLGRADGGVTEGIAAALAQVTRPGVGIPTLLLAFAVRPLLLLPVTVLTAFCGWWLGPVVGYLVALTAVSTTSLVPYAIARFARGAPAVGPAASAPSGWRGALTREPFRAVLLARLMMLPGDFVSAAAGALRVPWGTFLAATALGGAPGLAVGVLAGASLPRGRAFGVEVLHLDPWLLAGAIGAFALAWGSAEVLRRRSKRPSVRPTDIPETEATKKPPLSER